MGWATVDELEAQARLRFVSWDARLWRELVGGPARELGAALARAGAPAERAEALLRAYLELACEGIGLGYLFPAAAVGAENFFTAAWTRLLPRGLAAVAADDQAETLARCWNLGENLEASPAWLRRIFARRVGDLDGLGGLEALVADVARQALDPPAAPLGARATAHFIHLAAEDARFLPGGLHFLAPTVVCVHDRLRDGASIGVWLAERPLVLGAMGCREELPRAAGADAAALAKLLGADPRLTDAHAAARNAWRGALTLVTSQFVVGILP